MPPAADFQTHGKMAYQMSYTGLFDNRLATTTLFGGGGRRFQEIERYQT